MKPLHVNNGKTIAQIIADRTDYAGNPDKTNDGELVTDFARAPRTADAEFLLSKEQYAAITDRNQGRYDILAYHIRQAFKSGGLLPSRRTSLGVNLPGGSPKATTL
jgi:hypothetical protein